MKRTCVLLTILLCALMVFTAHAVEKAPGETANIPISVGSSNAHQIKLYITFDTNVFEYVGINSNNGFASFNPDLNRAVITLQDMYNPISAGQVGTISLRIKENVKSGEYSVDVRVHEAVDTEFNETTVSASAGSVTVKADCPHTETEEKITKPATCEAAGEKQIVCSCGEVISTEPIAALGHSFKTYTESKAATCEEKGKETAKCERCDKTDTRDIPALGHDVAAWTVTKEPTCEEKGVEESKCTRCGKTDTREVPALGHEVAAWTVTKEATCEEKGTEEAKCTRCGEGDSREIPALGHDVGEWTKTKDATCTEKGEESAVCSRCKKTDTREIPALGHDVADWMVTKQPTCTEKGEETAACTRCDKFDTREIPALGHAYGAWTATKEATCTEDGEEASECSLCHEKMTREIKALGHNGVWKVVIPATGKEEGLKQKICKRCDEVLEEDIIPVRKVESRTACTAGIKASELTSLKADYDWWKMVTAIDLTKEGVNRYPLIAGNVYEIGYVEITIEDGVVTADMVVDAPTVTMYTDALIFLSDPKEITFFDANFYEYYEFPASINLEDLPEEKAYMMVCCQLTIDLSKPEPKYYNFKSAEHMEFIEQQNEIIK